MRIFMSITAVLLLVCGTQCFASVPEQIAPRGGFIPLKRSLSAQGGGMKLPERGARFLPLPSRSNGVALPTVRPEIAAQPALPAEIEAKLHAKPKGMISEQDAKLLLSIFTEGD